MKKGVILIFFMVFCLNPSFADETETSQINSIEMLIKQKEHMNDTRIETFQTFVQGLTLDDRVEIYHQYEKNALAPFIVNIFVVGLGNAMLGDWKGALLGAVSFYGGSGVLIAGIREETGIVFGLGAGMMAVGYLTSIISPWTYTEKYNRNLRNALDIPVYVYHRQISESLAYSAGRTDLIRVNLLTFRF